MSSELEQSKLRKKIQKEYPDFVEAVNGMSVLQLEARLNTMAKHRIKTKQAKKEVEKLNEVAAIKAELESPYNDTLKALDIQSEYVALLIKEKGGQA